MSSFGGGFMSPQGQGGKGGDGGASVSPAMKKVSPCEEGVGKKIWRANIGRCFFPVCSFFSRTSAAPPPLFLFCLVL